MTGHEPWRTRIGRAVPAITVGLALALAGPSWGAEPMPRSDSIADRERWEWYKESRFKCGTNCAYMYLNILGRRVRFEEVDSLRIVGFDDLVDELLRRSLDGGSCAGTHIVFALTFIERADAQVPILSDGTRRQVRDRLASWVRLAEASQRPDGTWGHDWARETPRKATGGPAPEPPHRETLLVTSHLVEWMLYLPEGYRPPDEVLRRGGLWLLRSLREATPEMKEDAFCPYSHAASVLRTLSRNTRAGPAR